MMHLRRTMALVLAGALTCGLLSGCTKKPGNAGNGADYAGDGKPFSQATDISITVTSSASWPYNENWKIWQYFREESGANLQVTAIPDADVVTKINLMMSSPESLTDMIYMDLKATVDNHATSGAFVSLDENMEKLPNPQAYLDSLDPEVSAEAMRQRTSGDGHIYQAPTFGTETIQNLRSWMYRKDIFEKNNIEVPTNLEEVYQAAKQLKELYPESYPVCIRQMMRQFQPMGPQWRRNFDIGPFYDFEEEKWHYGAAEPEAKEIVEYFLKLYNEGLVSPDYVTIEDKTWEEMVSTDRGFIMVDYLVRLDFFNLPNREHNPDYTWAIMAPPKANDAEGQSLLGKTNVDYRGYVVCNTGKRERMDNALKLLDWMYTDKATEALSWGKEGDTYQTVDGEREFMVENKDNGAQQEYGVATAGTFQRIDPAAFEAAYTKEQIAQGREAVKYNEINANPANWLAFSEEDEDRKTELYTTLQSYVWEQMSKFMMAQTPMSEWDSFQKGLKDLGVDELITLYTDTYNRVTG